MPDFFVTVPIETDAQTLRQRAMDDLRSRWPGWTDNDGDMERIQAEVLAPMAADSAAAASRMFPAAFRDFGLKLYGVAYETGTPATTTVSINLTDTDGHEIPAGFEVDIDGYSFAVDELTAVPQGADTISGVSVTATELGAGQNDLAGSVVTPIGSLAFVESVVLDGPTDGGSDPETDLSYLNRLVTELSLRAKTLVTPSNFEAEALNEPGVGRAIAVKDNARNFTIVLTDADGEPVIQSIKDRLQDRFSTYKQVNTTINMPDATYTDVNVTYVVTYYPEQFNAADLEARINEMLSNWLAPGAWGRPKNFGNAATGWYNEPVVWKNKIIDLIGDVEGVNRVVSVTLSGSGTATVDGSGNLNLPGTVPLTRPGVFDGTIQ